MLMKGDKNMETMKNIFGLHQPTRLEARQLDDQNTQITEKSLIGALQSFFTENVNSLITATLIYFTLFAGFTRMKNKHLALAVPCAAIWTVHQAGALLLPLGGAAAVVAAAKAYFAWQGTNASEVAKEAVREGTTALANTALDAVKGQVLGQTTKGGTPTPEHQQRMQAVFEQVKNQQTTPTSTVQTTSPTTVVEDFDLDDALRDYEELELTDRRLPPETRGEFEAAWSQASSISTSNDWASEFLSQNPDAREMVSTLSKEQVKSFEEVWGMVQVQKPGAKMNDPWVKEFMSQQCNKKGLPWGKVAKYVGILAGAAAAGYGLYKLYQYVTTPAEEEKKEKASAVEQASKPATESEKKKKQALAMHLLFGQSKAAKVFQGALKKEVAARKAKAVPQQTEPSHVAAPVEQFSDKASRRLQTIMRHTSIPVERSGSATAPKPLAQIVQSPMTMSPEVRRRLEQIARTSGRCGAPFMQPGATKPQVARL